MVRGWLNKLYVVSGYLAAMFIALICLLVVSQVVLNLIDRMSTLITGTAVGLTIPSYADFTGFFLAAASFLALAYTLREGGHIRVTLVIGNLPTVIRRFFEIWCLGVATSITCYFTYYTARLVWESYSYNDLSAGMIAVPIWIPQCAMLMGLVILAIALLDELVAILSGRPASYADKGEKLLESDNELEELPTESGN